MQLIIERLAAGHHLTMDEMTGVIDSIMLGEVDDEDVAQLLLALREKGETVEEIAGAAAAMRKHMTPIRTQRTLLIDTCGTGGDASRTFNISTAAAIVTAAAGVPVAKHGNRGITSKSGSADVLSELGVNIEADVATVQRCLDQLGICFCYAPRMHPSMKNVAPVRKKLGVPTIFNLLGPLSNPASAPFQLLGVGRADLRPILAEALAKLGARRAVVVSGEDGLDEVTLDGATAVELVEEGRVRSLCWTPQQFGLPAAGREGMLVEGPAESAGVIRQILVGESGPPRDIVVANAAAALWTAGVDGSLATCAGRAAEAIDSGQALELLEQLALTTQS